MVIVCEGCGQKGTVDEQFYSGKKLRLRCPHCSYDFIFSVPSNGSLSGAGGIDSSSTTGPDSAGQPAAEQRPAPDTSDATVLEAKRIARLIISEIKLYNQDKIASAPSRREVLELLKEDLMRGRQHYNSRIASKLPLGPDYFMESVKDILLVGKS